MPKRVNCSVCKKSCRVSKNNAFETCSNRCHQVAKRKFEIRCAFEIGFMNGYNQENCLNQPIAEAHRLAHEYEPN